MLSQPGKISSNVCGSIFHERVKISTNQNYKYSADSEYSLSCFNPKTESNIQNSKPLSNPEGLLINYLLQMDIFRQVDDPLVFESSSDTCSSTEPRRASHSDEEVLLASNRPKKRAGRRVFKETRHPIFRGVRRRNNNKWVCELREPNKKTRIWLGTYPTPEMAARAHDVAALALRGKSACLNFADSAWRLPVPASKDAKDITKAAAEAAKSFGPHEMELVGRHIEESDIQFEEEVEKTLRKNNLLQENVFYVDEEAEFDMPGLLVNLAEGLLLSPPPLLFGEDDYHMEWNDCHGESDGFVSLWSHSV